MTIRKGNTIIAGNTPAGYEIGDIGLSAIGIDESLNYRRYLNGQEILQSQFKEFTKKIKRRVELYPSLACTNTEYETACTLSAHGQCGKFVIDDERGVIRLPKVVNVMGLSDMAEAGVTVEAGLPNITGKWSSYAYTNGYPTGAVASNIVTSNTIQGGSGSNYNHVGFNLDASRCSEVYGNSETVQQEAIKYPYFIQVASSSETTINLTRDIELNNPFSLFEYKFSEYAIDNISWLESKGQWNSNKVYVSAYEELLAIYNGKVREGVSVKKTTETYTDYDFVIDEAGNAFRLPIRVKETPLSAGKVGVAGNGMTLGLYSAAANSVVGLGSNTSGNLGALGAFYGKEVTDGVESQMSANSLPLGKAGVTEDKTKSGIEADLTDAVVDLKLYFYVGETVQDGNLINAGAVLEDVNTLKNTALTNNQITNCITEIPQRIKYTLEDGTLTILKGSVVIVPYGTEDKTAELPVGSVFINDNFKVYNTQFEDGKFFVWAEVVNDVVQVGASLTDTNERTSCLALNDNGVPTYATSGSGTSYPSSGSGFYFHTTDNKVVLYISGVVQSNVVLSLPIGRALANGVNAFGSIKQVFNGIGYIGSTVWVDKGVKGLIPDGRTEDGTLKNIEVVTNKIATFTELSTTSGGYILEGYVNTSSNLFNSSRMIYDKDKNLIINQNNNQVIHGFVFAKFSRDASTGFISNFNPSKTVQISNATEISSWSMPSSKYVTLTIGATNTRYTAPANGWVNFEMRMTNGLHQLSNVTKNYLGIVQHTQGTNAMTVSCIPVCKGDIFTIVYSNQGSNTADNKLKFIYAQGEV